MVELLERQIELAEEQNELIRENSQLLGDMLNSLETIFNRPCVVNVASEGQHVETLIDIPHTTSVKNILTEQKGPVPQPDAEALMLAFYGTAGPNDADTEVPIFNVFWPKANARPGWVRVSIQHPNATSLNERVRQGCMCGKAIVLKEHNGDSFYTCEALTQKGSCVYRPAAYFDKFTFLTNLPPTK